MKTQLDNATVLNGLLGTIALSIRASGGDDKDLAEVFRALADRYQEKAQHQTALSEAAVK